MKIFGYTPYNFGLRLILLTMILFIVVVIVQLYQYGTLVEKVEKQLFESWGNQEEVNLYRENCEKGPVSREEIKEKDRPFGKYACAEKYASPALSAAIIAVHNAIPEPPAPLKYL